MLGRDHLDLLRGRGVHLGEVTRTLADVYGQRPAVVDPSPSPGLHDGGTRTFDEVEDHVARLAAAHQAAGRTGRVLLAIGNRIDIVLHALALARIGALPIPINPRLTAHEFEAVAKATEADAGIIDGDADHAPHLPDTLEVTETADVAAWLAAHPDDRVTAEPGDPEDTALLLTTSGTTGVPKAAALTSRGLLGGVGLLLAAPVGSRRGLRANRDLVLASLPLTHVMGFSTVLACWCAGVAVLRRERFDADETIDLIEQDRPNVVVGVPTMYADLESAGIEQRDVSSIQLWVSAADVMPIERARRFQQFGAAFQVNSRPIGSAAFVDIYGMVELSGPAALRVLPPSPIGSIPAPSVAKTLPGFEVRAIDEDGRPLKKGTTGELQFRGPGVLRGYEGKPDAGPDPEGWLSTGDHGRVLRGGFFQFSGRARDRLKVGGFSVFPAEVEEELRDSPGVTDLAIVGVPDDRLGERPVALVVAAPGFDEEKFLGWAESEVAGYRRPRQVVVVDELPRGNHGKIDRESATEMAVNALS